jgi:dihydropyrimidinase
VNLTAIRNAKLVTPSRIIEGGVVIEDGRIAAVARDSELPTRGDVYDAGGRYVIPGVVDPEAHLGSSAPLDFDFASETRAAVAAGVTTWNLHQTTHTIFRDADGRPPAERQLKFSDVAQTFVDIGEERSHCDFMLTPLLMTEEQAAEIPELARRWGLVTYKLYMHMRLGRERLTAAWAAAPKLGVQTFDDALVFKAMRETARLGPAGLLSAHCENWEIALVLEQELRAQGRTDTAAWNERSPDYLEAMHVRAYGYLAAKLACRFHVQHVTTAETIAALTDVRRLGTPISGQTGVHYLLLDESDWKLNTPLRGAGDRAAVWAALADGRIDSIGTDHVNRAMSRREMERGDVWTDVSGFASRVEAHLPLLLSEGVNRGRISIERLSEIVSANPARIWSMYPRKGTIEVGADADLVVVDLDRKARIDESDILAAAGWSLYEGWDVQGWPTATILRGAVVSELQDDRYVVAEAPSGRFVQRMASKALGVAVP